MLASPLIAQAACHGRGPAPASMDRKLFILGIDGIDPAIVSGMWDEGELPNMKKLAETGTFCRFPTITPPQSPAAWSTLASGVYPETHGVFDFIQRRNGTYLPYLSINKIGRSGKFEKPSQGIPFWRLTTAAGIPTYVYRWPATFPADEVSGAMLGGLGTPDIKGFLGVYSFYTDEDIPIPLDVRRNVKRISFAADRASAVLSGPMTGRDTFLEKEFSVIRNSGGIQIMLEGKTVLLRPNEWSPYFYLEFKRNFLESMSGIVKFYLMSVAPFKLYASPVEIAPQSPLFPYTYPKNFSALMSKDLGSFHTLGMPEDANALNKGHLTLSGFKTLCDGIHRERQEMFNWGLEHFHGGVFAFVFDTSDRLQHIFYRTSHLAAELREHYKSMDGILGSLMPHVGPKDLLMVISDHGITSYDYNFHLNTFLVKNGFMQLKAQPDDSNSGELFSLVDWSKTQAYGVGFSGIYVNLRGREPAGIVEQSNKAGVIRRLKEALLNYSPPGMTKPVFALYDQRSAPGLDAPDLVIGVHKGYRVSSLSALGGVGDEIINANDLPWAADHIVDRSFVNGIFFSNQKVVRPPMMVDIAPTVAAFFRIKPDSSWIGSSLL